MIARLAVENTIGEKMDGTPLDDPNAGKNPHAVALGEFGGAKGCMACTAILSKRKLKAIGKKALRRTGGRNER